MMTKKKNQGDFNIILSTLEDLVDANHPVRKYDKAIDWNFIYPLVEDLYSTTGAPSIDPIVLFKLVFINYIDGIHSMRKTCERCKTDVAYRWFLRINFFDNIPDHSTYSQNLRRKFLGTNLFNDIFTKIITEAYKAGFIDCENIFGDSTHVKANANKKKHVNEIVEITKSLYYDDLLKDINDDRIFNGKKPIKKDDNDDTPNSSNTIDDDTLTKSSDEDELVDVEENKDGEATKKTLYDHETGEMKAIDPKIKYKNTKKSTIDPDAGFYHKGEHEKQFAYSASALCDKNGFILDTFITSGNIHDSISFKGLFENFKNNFLFNKTKLICLDAGYKSPSVSKLILDSGKKILVPYSRPMTKKGFFKKSEYVFDDKYNRYICPNNEFLEYTTTNRNGYREYKSNANKCKTCPYLKQCTESKNYTKVVTQHVWYDYTEMATDIRYEIGSKEIYKKRKETIERCFGEGKENFGLRFTRYRGIEKVRQNISLVFACMNFKKMANWKWKNA